MINQQYNFISVKIISDAWANDWQGLLDELTQYNYEYGSELESTLIEAWSKGTDALNRYGMSATNTIDNILAKIREQLQLMEEAEKYGNNVVVSDAYEWEADNNGNNSIVSRTGDLIKD